MDIFLLFFFFAKQITVISVFRPLEFWCSEGHLARFDQILTLFKPAWASYHLFRRADLTYSTCPVYSPGGPDLYPPISTYFVTHHGYMDGKLCQYSNLPTLLRHTESDCACRQDSF